MKNIILLLFLIGSWSVRAQTGAYTPTGTVAGATTNPSTGNVGIGTSTPRSPLELRVTGDNNTVQTGLIIQQYNPTNPNNSAGVSLDFGIGNNDTNNNILGKITLKETYWATRPKMFFSLWDVNNTMQDRMVVDYSGNVGIGTISPQANLHIEGPSGLQSKLAINNPFVGGVGGSLDIAMGSGNSSYASGIRGYVPSGMPGIDRVFLGLYTTTYSGGLQSRIERLTISDKGDVGIGTSPLTRFHVDGQDGLQSRLNINNPSVGGVGGSLDITMGSGSNSSYAAGIRGYVPSGQPGVDRVYLGLYTTTYNGSLQSRMERMTIADNGNVGIGTTNPSSILSVKGDYGLSIEPSSSGPVSFYVTSNSADNIIGVNARTKIGSWEIPDNSKPSSFIDFSTYNVNNPYYGGIAFYTRNSGASGIGSEKMVLLNNGNVGIGNTSPDAKLAVSGQVHAQEVKVSVTVPGPDYVFEKEYKLTSLEEIKTYIDQNKHLPEVPSAKEMEKNGVQLGEMNMLLLKKIEELTLYAIEMNKRMEEMKEENATLKTRVEKIEKQ
ncbi:MAG: hypothetical protein HYR67_03510 [Bacteroidetes bacterium]|nr:hypothetical protein [Bacteroidota bacterium]